MHTPGPTTHRGWTTAAMALTAVNSAAVMLLAAAVVLLWRAEVRNRATFTTRELLVTDESGRTVCRVANGPFGPLMVMYYANGRVAVELGLPKTEGQRNPVAAVRCFSPQGTMESRIEATAASAHVACITAHPTGSLETILFSCPDGAQYLVLGSGHLNGKQVMPVVAIGSKPSGEGQVCDGSLEVAARDGKGRRNTLWVAPTRSSTR